MARLSTKLPRTPMQSPKHITKARPMYTRHIDRVSARVICRMLIQKVYLTRKSTEEQQAGL